MSIQRATTETHGPFRRVVAWRWRAPTRPHQSHNLAETLECGHAGEALFLRSWGWERPRARRRCWSCQWETITGRTAAQATGDGVLVAETRAELDAWINQWESKPGDQPWQPRAWRLQVESLDPPEIPDWDIRNRDEELDGSETS